MRKTGRSGQVAARDIRRLFSAPRALIIVIGVLVTPSLYAWFNINAFWDPYTNTRNLHIAVVNNDRGATAEAMGTGGPTEIDVGARITEQLKNNDRIGWEFLPEDQARAGLMRGDYYAMFLIPPTFSEDLLSLVEGTYTQPRLEYLVNEKTNGVAPSITDAGASAVDKAVAEAFKKQVGEGAAAALREAGITLRDDTEAVRGSASGGLGRIAEDLSTAAGRVSTMKATVEGARPVVAETMDLVDSVDAALGDVDAALGDAEAALAELRAGQAAFTTSVSTALVESTDALYAGARAANASLGSATDRLTAAQGRARTAVGELHEVVGQGERAAAEVRELSRSGQLSPEVRASVGAAADALEERSRASRTVVTGLGDVDRSASATLEALNELGGTLEAATGESSATARDARDQLAAALPAINASLAEASGTVASVRGAAASQRALTGQTTTLLAGVDNQLVSTLGILDELAADLATLSDGARAAQSDISALLATSDSQTLATITGLNSVQIGDYLASPVEVSQQAVFPTDTYGSSMAAFFTNLALWIGAFVLTIIFRVEVDRGDFTRLTVGRAYMGRFLLFATLSLLQATVVSAGNLAFGVKMVSFPVFYATAAAIGVAYTGIVYALVSALGHIGRGLAVLMVVIQIPGASGLYPIELMPGFFRSVYPLLPFRYGIDAMRETIAGFYGAHYLRFMAVLCAMSAASLGAGWLLRRTSSHANLLFNHQLARTNLIAHEKVEVMGSPYRLSDVMSALSDRAEYRDHVARRARFLREHYRTLIASGLGAGAAGVIAVTCLTALLPTDKSVLLAIVVAWVLAVALYLAAVEYLARTVADSERVSQLADEELRDAVIGTRVHANPEMQQ